MANISLTGSLRTPKVTTGLAANLQSMRSLYPSEIINPDRNLYETYGRPGPIDSMVTQTVGTSASYRVNVENTLRPQYSYYLNLPEGIDQNSSMSSRMQSLERDTLGVQRDQAFNMNPAYKVVGPPRGNIKVSVPNSDMSFLSSVEEVNRISNRGNMTTRYGAGSNDL